MAEHTPGNWQARFIYRVMKRVRESPGDLLMMGDGSKDWADARIMAAGPNLLAALERLAGPANFDVSDHNPECGCCVCEARLAIAKAKEDVQD